MSNRPGISADEYERADEFQITSTTGDHWSCDGLDGERAEIPKSVAKTQEDARAVLALILSAEAAGYQTGERNGRKTGRAEVIDTVHELLGINKLTAELRSVTAALYEIRGD